MISSNAVSAALSTRWRRSAGSRRAATPNGDGDDDHADHVIVDQRAEEAARDVIEELAERIAGGDLELIVWHELRHACPAE